MEFFKVVPDDRWPLRTDELCFPPAVYSLVHGRVSQDVTMRDSIGRTLQVKLLDRLVDRKIVLGHGWPTLSAAHNLWPLDYLVFRLVDNSTFQVSVFCDCGLEVGDFTLRSRDPVIDDFQLAMEL
ncbi:hypothetical protein COLO4_28107 [Corchorus olitorius]|uniref:TF-B3 domain-containing protein n=1 Tax=Corchorus olitorius TaxID=93759 RepID=A0A1R3HMR8_9ROSI|nr:hypothetical protein COLO4_28107 [Corchorus olitorius]